MLSDKFNKLILLIFPLILVLLGTYMKRVIQDYSMFSVDPDYCYLFNGLNLAHHNFPWHIDHPGTPLQLLSAIVIRLVHLFRNDTLDMDLFKNPELYINAINYTIIYLQAIVLFFTGLTIFRRKYALIYLNLVSINHPRSTIRKKIHDFFVVFKLS